MSDGLAYKVLTAAQFTALQAGTFTAAPVDAADGYVHLSTAAQLTETVRKHFAGQNGLVLAAVALARLGDALRWEVSRNGALFPHFYGQLKLEHVVAYEPMRWRDGTVALPGGTY